MNPSFVYPAMVAVANPGTGTVDSAAISSRYYTWVSAQATFSDSNSAGPIKLQASNDITNPTNWNDIPNATSTVTAGGDTLIPKTDCNYRWIRIRFSPSGGGGTFSVNLNVSEGL